MSTARDGEKGPSGEDKGGGKGKGKAQVVGAEEHGGGNNNTSKHADTDEFWSQHSGGERISKLFGAHGAGGTQEQAEVGMALTPNNEGASDEEMDAAAPDSPTPVGKRNQPMSKKRRFSAVPTTPRRNRTLARGSTRIRTSATASLGDISALFAAAKEILEQGRAAEAAATAGWMRMEQESQAHKQGVNSMFDRITTIQSDFRTAIKRDDVLENVLEKMGNAIEQDGIETGRVNETVTGAATEIGWLKARMGTLEKQVEQTHLEVRATKAAAIATAKSMQKKEDAQEAHQEEERASRAATDECLTAGVHSAVEMMVKQITKLENIVYRKEDEIRDNIKAEHQKLQHDFLAATAELRKAYEKIARLETDKGKGTGAPQPRAPRASLLIESEDSDPESDEESEYGVPILASMNGPPAGTPNWDQEVEDEIQAAISDLRETRNEMFPEAMDQDTEEESEAVESVPPLIARAPPPPPLTNSRKARERRHKAEGMEASRHATPGASNVHPDRAHLIGRPITPPAPLLLNRDGSTTEIKTAALTPASYGTNKPAAEKVSKQPSEKVTKPRPAAQKAIKKPSYAEAMAAPAPSTPKGGWKEVGKGKNTKKEQKKPVETTPPIFNKRKGPIPYEDRRIALDRQSREGGNPAPNTLQLGRITSAINIALFRAKAPAHVRIEAIRSSAKGNLTASAAPGADAKMLLHFRELILQAARSHDNDIVDVRSNENWPRLKVMVPVAPYCERDGLEMLKEVIEAENDGTEVTTRIRWLKPWALIRQHQPPMATVLFSVCDRKQAQKLLAGMRIAGRKHTAAAFIPEGTDSQCAKCCEWGHTEFRCNRNRVFCGLCAEDHTTDKHSCPVKDCRQARGRLCPHTVVRCAACNEDSHPATAFSCPARKAAKAAARGIHASQEAPEKKQETTNTAT